MKICAIGDPHGDLKRIKEIPLSGIDLILLTGDLGSSNLARKMSFENIKRKKEGLKEIEYTSEQKKKAFLESYNSTIKLINYLRKFVPTFIIFGNVELSNSETRKKAREINMKLPYLYNKLNSLKNVRVINNRIANFKGVRIGGLEYFIDTNWVKEFEPSDYLEKLSLAKKQTEKAKKVLKWFDSVDILLCHQPPYRILDKVSARFVPKHWKGKNAGSKTILEYIKSKKPKYVFCGHIHEAEGTRKVGKTELFNLGSGSYKITEFKSN
jgi:Icc-related predicted phosphoesterase